MLVSVLDTVAVAAGGAEDWSLLMWGAVIAAMLEAL
jgi:hypothetical protein